MYYINKIIIQIGKNSWDLETYRKMKKYMYFTFFSKFVLNLNFSKKLFRFTTTVMLMENKTPFIVATEQFSMNISEPVTILELFIAKVGRVMLAHQPTRPTRSTLILDITILNQAIIPRVSLS